MQRKPIVISIWPARIVINIVQSELITTGNTRGRQQDDVIDINDMRKLRQKRKGDAI